MYRGSFPSLAIFFSYPSVKYFMVTRGYPLCHSPYMYTEMDETVIALQMNSNKKKDSFF